MKISKGKTLAEEIYSTVTPDVMKTIEATEAHKEQSDKVNKELDKKAEDFVKDTEKVNKEVKSIMKKKLHMSESLEEDTEEYVDEFTDVYREIANNFPDNQRKSSFVRDETFGIIRIYSDDPDEQKSISDMAKKHRGVTTEIKDGYVEVVAPTRRKASSSKTYHDLFDEVYAQLTADGDKYDVWGKFSDNIGAGYAVNQIGSVGGSEENIITVTVDPDKAAQAKAERTRYISTLDPAIEVVKRYKEDGVTYSQRKDGEADVLVITVPNKKASMKDVRVTYDETGRPVANKRGRSGENKGYFDKETIDTTQKGYLKKFRDLRNKGYEVVHTDEKIIYMVAPKKKDKVNESKKLTESGIDVLYDLIDRAKSWVDDGDDPDEAVQRAIDDGLIYTQDIIDLAVKYGVIDDGELIGKFYDDLYSDMIGEVTEYAEESEDEEDTDESLKESANKNRYQIVTFSYDSGEDEKREYKNMRDAIRGAKEYIDDDYYDTVAIYDYENGSWNILKGSHSFTESLKESDEKSVLKATNVKVPGNWVVAKYKNKYALMGKSEFERASQDPDKWFKEWTIDLFPSIKELISNFKREPYYRHIFKDFQEEYLTEESKKGKYAVKHENGKYVSKDYNVGSFDRAAKFATEEEAEKFISDNGKDKTWKDHYTIVDISK